MHVGYSSQDTEDGAGERHISYSWGEGKQPSPVVASYVYGGMKLKPCVYIVYVMLLYTLSLGKLLLEFYRVYSDVCPKISDELESMEYH